LGVIPPRRAGAGASVDYSGPKVGQNGLVLKPSSRTAARPCPKVPRCPGGRSVSKGLSLAVG